MGICNLCQTGAHSLCIIVNCTCSHHKSKYIMKRAYGCKHCESGAHDMCTGFWVTNREMPCKCYLCALKIKEEKTQPEQLLLFSPCSSVEE